MLFIDSLGVGVLCEKMILLRQYTAGGFCPRLKWQKLFWNVDLLMNHVVAPRRSSSAGSWISCLVAHWGYEAMFCNCECDRTVSLAWVTSTCCGIFHLEKQSPAEFRQKPENLGWQQATTPMFSVFPKESLCLRVPYLPFLGEQNRPKKRTIERLTLIR